MFFTSSPGVTGKSSNGSSWGDRTTQPRFLRLIKKRNEMCQGFQVPCCCIRRVSVKCRMCFLTWGLPTPTRHWQLPNDYSWAVRVLEADGCKMFIQISSTKTAETLVSLESLLFKIFPAWNLRHAAIFCNGRRQQYRLKMTRDLETRIILRSAAVVAANSTAMSGKNLHLGFKYLYHHLANTFKCLWISLQSSSHNSLNEPMTPWPLKSPMSSKNQLCRWPGFIFFYFYLKQTKKHNSGWESNCQM